VDVVEVAPGAFHLPHALSLDRQRALVDRCRALVDGDVPAYVPVVRGGGKMHVRMLCLGRHWNGKTYTYERREAISTTCRRRRCRRLHRARTRARRVGRDVARADLCILNYYDAEGRMGCIRTRTRAFDRSRPACPSYRCRSAIPRDSCLAAYGGRIRSRPASRIG
jgi:alkylated DNA repair protein (DNA oxidative demethylase)